jgi:hypothetical protein
MNYALVNSRDDIIRQQAFPEGVTPDVLPEAKGLRWRPLTETEIAAPIIAAAASSATNKGVADHRNMIRRRAARLAKGSAEDKCNAILLLKTIGE